MYNIYSSSRILRSGQLISATAIRVCLPSVSRNVYMQSPSSSYHTKTQVRCKLLRPNSSFSQFSTMPAQRSNSYITSVLQKVFVVKAAEPFHEGDIPDAPPFTVGSTAESVSETASTGSVLETANTGTVESTVGSGFDTYIPPPPEISYIPPPPAPPEAISQPLNALGEPTLQSLGLGGWSPSGLLQNFVDSVHVTLDLPWWGAIAVVTVCIRLLVFPLVVKMQRNSANLHNVSPQLRILQMKMTEARNSGNSIQAARMSHEIAAFMEEKQINPIQSLSAPFLQAPIFLSMFMGLRGMANLPVESMKDGGMFWFADLTIADPFYILPFLTAITMTATIELGADGMKASSMASSNAKWILRAIPFLVFPWSINFPAAVLCYWVSTNVFSLFQVGIFKSPVVREFFNIPKLLEHKRETIPQRKGIVNSIKESMSNMRITKELAERERYDEIRFKRAGLGPIVRTHKHDPTKKIINVQAKVKK